MCVLCVEVQKQRMTVREVARAFRETVVSNEHFDEVLETINKNYGTDEVAVELSDLYLEELAKEKK